MEENCMISHTPIKDWICPRCRHNIGYKQGYCSICGLQLKWPVENIVYIYSPIHKFLNESEFTTATPKIPDNIHITC